MQTCVWVPPPHRQPPHLFVKDAEKYSSNSLNSASGKKEKRPLCGPAEIQTKSKWKVWRKIIDTRDGCMNGYMYPTPHSLFRLLWQDISSSKNNTTTVSQSSSVWEAGGGESEVKCACEKRKGKLLLFCPFRDPGTRGRQTNKQTPERENKHTANRARIIWLYLSASQPIRITNKESKNTLLNIVYWLMRRVNGFIHHWEAANLLYL